MKMAEVNQHEWRSETVSYEHLCEIGRAHSENLDRARWQIGDVANLVMELYSERTVDEFAKDINQRKSTVYQYGKVAKFYDVDMRERLREEMPNLSYSHLREGLRIASTCTPEVIAWLEEVSDNSWTADEASRKLTERLGHETRENIEGIYCGNSFYDGQYHAEFIISEADKKRLENIDKVVIRAK